MNLTELAERAGFEIHGADEAVWESGIVQAFADLVLEEAAKVVGKERSTGGPIVGVCVAQIRSLKATP